MCTPGSVQSSGDALGSAADALGAAGAALDYLNSPAAADLNGSACGELLIGLGEVQAKLAAAHAGFLRRFGAANAHDADGYGSSPPGSPPRAASPVTAREHSLSWELDGS